MKALQGGIAVVPILNEIEALSGLSHHKCGDGSTCANLVGPKIDAVRVAEALRRLQAIKTDLPELHLDSLVPKARGIAP